MSENFSFDREINENLNLVMRELRDGQKKFNAVVGLIRIMAKSGETSQARLAVIRTNLKEFSDTHLETIRDITALAAACHAVAETNANETDQRIALAEYGRRRNARRVNDAIDKIIKENLDSE